MHSKFIRRAPRWQVILAVITCAFISKWAPAQTTDTAKLPKFDITKPFGETYRVLSNVATDQTRLVIYRPRHSAVKAGVISVYINDRYHTSLLQDAYTTVCFDSNFAQVRTRLIDAQGEQQDPELDKSAAISLHRDGIVFLRVTELANKTTHLNIVSPKVANQDLVEAREQKHALSRVPQVQACRQEQSAIVTFGTGVTFNQHQAVLSAEAQKELSNIINKMNGRYKSANQVKVSVVGYADDTTQEPRNERLSRERAKAVTSYLVDNGLQAQDIKDEGRGSKDEHASMATSRENRRVEVEVKVALRQNN